MNEHQDIIKSDPVYTIGFNDGLEYSVRWIEDSAKGRAFDDATIPEFAALNAISLRLAKEPVNQQDFYDALRADPEMYEKLRAEVERLREALQSTIEKINEEMADWACVEYPYLCADMIPLYNIRSVATAALNPTSSVGDVTNGVGEGEATDV